MLCIKKNCVDTYWNESTLVALKLKKTNKNTYSQKFE